MAGGGGGGGGGGRGAGARGGRRVGAGGRGGRGRGPAAGRWPPAGSLGRGWRSARALAWVAGRTGVVGVPLGRWLWCGAWSVGDDECASGGAGVGLSSAGAGGRVVRA